MADIGSELAWVGLQVEQDMVVKVQRHMGCSAVERPEVSLFVRRSVGESILELEGLN